MQHAPHHRHFSLIRLASPAQDPESGVNRKQRHRKKQRQLRDESSIAEIERSTLFEIKDAQQADHEQHTGGDAEREIGGRQASRVSRIELVADYDELDDERRDQRESRQMMEEGKESTHSGILLMWP
jgi:hypothetical protein